MFHEGRYFCPAALVSYSLVLLVIERELFPPIPFYAERIRAIPFPPATVPKVPNPPPSHNCYPALPQPVKSIRSPPRHGSGASRSAWRPACADSVPAPTACRYRLSLAADRARESTYAAFCYVSDRCFLLVRAGSRRTGADGDGRRVCRLGPVRCPSGMEDQRECRREAESGRRFWSGRGPFTKGKKSYV